CGRTDEDTINVTVTLNNEPVANAGADQTLFLCSSTQICWPASCSDPDGNLTDCIFNGPGSYDGSQICFTPPTSGTYTFTLRAEDDCGLFDVDEAVITVVLNEKPTVAFGNDTSLALCAQQQICLDYTVNDPDGHGKVLETMEAGYGTLDTAANNICFTPTASGNYEFIVRATDSCGAFDEDTILVSVTYGTAANIDCPAGAIDVFLCDPDQVCRTIDITPSTAVITTSFGTYSGGDLCFQADTSGTYVIQLTAETDCGTDQCQLAFNVDIGTAPQITCPAPQSKFICEAGSVCIPVGVMGAGATVTVSPIGTYSSGNICFPADTSGHYELEVIATTACGADTCLVVADITINSPPVAVDPASPVDTFLCDPAEICYQFEASDADGQQLTWSKLNGNGSVTADGLWCFTPTGAFPYSVTVAVTDECGKSDTTNLTYNVVINSGPTVSFESQKSTPPLPPVEDVYLCGPEDICRTYITSDANDNIVLEEVETPGATIDTVANEICIYADTAGYYELIVTVTDDCGAYATSLIGLNVHFNTPPIANAGSDQTVEQCTPASICWPAGCTDDFGLDSCYLITPVGSYDGSQICFTPDTAGTYTFIMRAVDKCGEVDLDTALVTVDLNSSPICQVPNDTSIFQCAAAEVSLPVSGTDPDGNFDHCELLRGPGSIAGGQWTYTPTADQTVKVVVMCLDACGASCTDSFTVTFRINAPPVVDLGADTTIFLCQADSLCIDVDVSDEDNNLMLVEKLSVGGNYNPSTGELCFPTTYGVDKMYTLIMRATDSCGAVDVDTAKIYVDFNSPPVVEGPPDFTAFVEQPGELCFDVTISDQDDNLTGVTVSPTGTYSSQTGQICFDADTTGTYCFTVTATDACGLQTVEVICVDVEIDECVHVQIEKVHNTLQGHIESVDINLNGSGKPLGGFEFLISYDASVLTALTASPGQLFESCGWEYFTYRYGVDGNCTGACPSGLIKIVGLAETNNGAYHPGCFFDGMVGTLASMEFLVSNNRNYECQFVPIEFFWDDCADNTFSSMAGDTMWISREVYGFELNNITDNSYGFPGKYGAPDLCLEGGGPGKPTPFRCVDFTNGGIDIICADSIDDRGDINLNGLAYEVADAVMFSNYFIYGLDAFGTGPQVEASIAASDVNGDGIALSVADLVYLIRVVVGDAAAMPKPNPSAAYEAEFSVVNNVLTVSNASTEIGAIHLLIAGDARPSLDEHVTDMELQYRFDGADTRVLIYNRNASAYLEEGPILNLGTSGRIKSIEVGSFDGYVMAARLSSLPETYSLSQNYPNPFNPVTTIEFALPEAGEWELVIYNILGQVVEQWKKEGQAGYYKVEWDAGRYASGVYFYRLRAGEYSATRKMVLLK
ncbi:MAG: T9SS type A sorting domain-containing protein, partial [Candidatus Zixiibacteriota bacterium]